MSERVQQDSFIDDSEESCPLCIEEFDLSDKNFRPCPCGYQICQFCYNNIKTTMNGLCPACRRPYDEKNIQWKVISPEEFKADLQAQQRKKAAARQKEAEKRQAESQNRKHLAGLRVVQKNLVYVVGLNPRIREDELLQTLRGDQYFGQYGKIIKIVVSKAKEGSSSIGVYVTFSTQQEAERCIAAVDGSQNGERILRAQFGTTKYCSAFLRNEQCMNKSCMFLHETGDATDSFSRQDLSSMNVISTQRPANSHGNIMHAGPLQPQPPPQHAPLAAASQPMRRQGSKDTPTKSENNDGPALPPTASWAAKSNQTEPSRASSRAASQATPSPKAGPAAPVSQISSIVKAEEPPPVAEEIKESKEAKSPATPMTLPESLSQKSLDESPTEKYPSFLSELLQYAESPAFAFQFSAAVLTEDERSVVKNFPPLIDEDGGIKRRAYKKKLEEERKKTEAHSVVHPSEEAAEAGSLQLGGEPEDSRDVNVSRLGRQDPRTTIQPPQQQATPGVQTVDAQSGSLPNVLSGRSLTPQQLMLLKAGGQTPYSLDQYQGLANLGFDHFQNQSSVFQNQHQQLGSTLSHGRQSSRYSFATETPGLPALKSSMNTKYLSQSSAFLSGLGQTSQAQQPPLSNHFFSSGVQGPPPGLKAAGTPPISGGGMFGQGHGFTSTMGGGLNFAASNVAGKDGNVDLMRELLRGRNSLGGVGNGQGLENMTKHYAPSSYSLSPSFASVASLASPAANSASVGSSWPLNILQIGRGSASVISPPPGLTLPHAHPAPLSSQQSSHNQDKVHSSTSTLPTKSNITPAITPAVPVLIPSSKKLEKAPVKERNPQAKASGKVDGEAKSGKLVEERSPGEIRSPAVMNHRSPVNKRIKPTLKEIPETKTGDGTIKAQTTEQAPGPNHNIPDSRNQTDRKPLGKLDVSAAQTSGTSLHSWVPETPAKNSPAPHPSQPIMSRPGTPAKASQRSDSPAPRLAPRTIRVVATPKTETPVPGTPTGSYKSVLETKYPSRQPSIASAHRPGTPVSLFNSDAASFTSTSLSRANSPPPTKVGSAPVRQMSKSQAKKERQARAKAVVEAKRVDTTENHEELLTHAPVEGRKKKAKKITSTPKPKSRSETPITTAQNSDKEKADKSKEVNVKTIEPKKQAEEAEEIQVLKKEKQSPMDPKAVLNAMSAPSLLRDLEAKGELPPLNTLCFFKNVPGLNTRFDQAPSQYIENHAFTKLFTEDSERLSKGEPIHLVSERTSGGKERARILITGRKEWLYGLSEEMEERYLELEKRVYEQPEPGRYHPTQALLDGDSATFGALAAEIFGSPTDQDHASADSSLVPQDTWTTLFPPLEPQTAEEGSSRPIFPDWAALRTDSDPLISDTTSMQQPSRQQNETSSTPETTIEIMEPKDTTKTVEEVKTEWELSRRETEMLEKKLNQLIKRNKRLAFASGGR